MYYLENGVEFTADIQNAFKHGVTRCQLITDEYLINESGLYIMADDNKTDAIIVTTGYDEENRLISAELIEARNVPNLRFYRSSYCKTIKR